ncbi:MAG: STAS domain-containing protein [Thermoleophilia bacterium]
MLHVECHESSPGLLIVALTGICDFDTVPQIDSYLRRRYGPFHFRRHLLFDLEGVTMIDSSFVGFLMGVMRRLRLEHKELVLARPRGDVRRVLSSWLDWRTWYRCTRFSAKLRRLF